MTSFDEQELKKVVEKCREQLDADGAEGDKEEAKLEAALEPLLSLEKSWRNKEDEAATKAVASAVVDLCFERKAYATARRMTLLISKRKGQMKAVVKRIVQIGHRNVLLLLGRPAPELGDGDEQKENLDKAAVDDDDGASSPSSSSSSAAESDAASSSMVDDVLSADDEVVVNELIDTLRKITEGKIYVENERARLTKILSERLEADGKVAEASKLLQSVQVETYGAMGQREKIDFLLEQTRLCLDSGDWVRAKIISNKVSARQLQKAAHADLKLRYHRLMIRYYAHEQDFLEICRAYLQMYVAMAKTADAAERDECLRMVSAYIVLAERAPEQSDLLHRVRAFKQLEELPAFKRLLEYFITVELIEWSRFAAIYQPILDQLSVFKEQGSASAAAADDGDDKNAGGDDALPLWKALRDRVIEHNIRVVSTYYVRISTDRLAALLELSVVDAQKHLARLVVAKQVYARIDRPKAIVVFRKPREPSDELNQWSSDVSELLTLLQRTSHLIHRENMVHRITSN
jgi:26S proteasome regulatory subunit N5